MIEFGGVIYYIDLDALSKAISPSGVKPSDKYIETEIKTVKDEKGKLIGTEQLETINERGKEIDATKYETIRTMIEVLIDYDEDTDTSLGVERAFDKMPISFKIAFNTLYECGVLKEKE
jgi:hypothetical protein